MTKVGTANDSGVTAPDVRFASASWQFGFRKQGHHRVLRRGSAARGELRTLSAANFEKLTHMKATTWSAVALVGFTALSATHCNIARALTYEETACVSQTMSEGGDVTKCFNLGGDGGSAGSGGSGGAGGDTSSGSGGGWYGKMLNSADCTAPSFWYTGPIEPENVSWQNVMNKRVMTFTRAMKDGGVYEFKRTYEETYDTATDWHVVSASYTWTVTPLDSSVELTETSHCNVFL